MNNWYLFSIVCVAMLGFAVLVVVLLGNKPNKTKSRKSRLLIKEYSIYQLSLRKKANNLLEQLMEVDCTSKDVLEKDNWFRANTLNFMRDGECLTFINHYKNVLEIFFKNMEILEIRPEKDEMFQSLIVSISSANEGANFSNLLYCYATRWSLLPEIETQLMEDVSFLAVKHMYLYARDHK